MVSDEAVNLSEELSPYLVYRLCGEQMECAVWTLNEGHKALALFLSQENAEAFVKATDLGSDWKVLCPARADLLDEQLEIIVEAITRVTNAERGSLFLNDPQTNELYSRVALGGDSVRSPGGDPRRSPVPAVAGRCHPAHAVWRPHRRPPVRAILRG